MCDARTVSLDRMVAARDARARRQADARNRYPDYPLISITLVSPGPIKESLRLRRVMHAALEAVDECLSFERWPVFEREVFWLPTGAEALYVVNAKAEVLKAALVELESRHSLGRLWDLDVIAASGPLSRGKLGIAPRRCLICNQPAHACARSQQHHLLELSAKIEEMVDAFGHTAHAA